jgi:hypothetical protein
MVQDQFTAEIAIAQNATATRAQDGSKSKENIIRLIYFLDKKHPALCGVFCFRYFSLIAK